MGWAVCTQLVALCVCVFGTSSLCWVIAVITLTSEIILLNITHSLSLVVTRMCVWWWHIKKKGKY